MEKKKKDRFYKSKVLSDFLVIAGCTIAALLCMHVLDLAEIWETWADRYEHLEVDEIPFALSFASVGLAWFATRRWLEFRHQLSRTEEANRLLEQEMEQRKKTEGARIAAEISARKAEEISNAKSEFLANMSHEIRTPLNGVLGMANLMLDTELDTNQKECVSTILQSGEILLTILNDILDFSKIEAGKMEIEATDFDLVELLDSTAELLAPQAHSKGLEIPICLSSSVPRRLRGDDGRIRQILVNLISNAIKFTEKGGAGVEISSERTADNPKTIVLRFDVSDTGIGIPENMRQTVFEEFAQADGSVTRRYGGAGLGLAICKRLVTLMNGQIGIEGREGSGALVWFTVVLERSDESGAWATTLQGELTDRRVLVVDDNPINRLVVEKQLTSLGVDVASVPDAEAALAALKTAAEGGHGYDVAIIDHMMPVTDGPSLAAMIRAAPGPVGTKLVLSSSSGMVNSAARAKELGFDAALPKPLRPGALIKCVSALFRANDTNQQPLPTPALQTASADSVKARVLLAEDNAVNQLVVVGLLKKQGYSVDVVANGLEAVAAARQLAYDLVLMDIQMPDMGGIEAARKIRQSGQGNAAVPIIAVTAHALKGDRERFIDSGMDDYLVKPVSRRDLLQKVAYWTGAAQGAGDRDGGPPTESVGENRSAGGI